jgi:hypothetical protein
LAFVVSEAQNRAYAYVNGELYSTVNANGGWIGNSTVALAIGSWYSDPKFYGKIADVRIWKTARTADEIKASFNKNLAGENTDLAVNYKFSSFEREIANSADLTSNAICKPELDWNIYHEHEVLTPKPVNITITQKRISWNEINTLTPDDEIAGNYVIKIDPER